MEFRVLVLYILKNQGHKENKRSLLFFLSCRGKSLFNWTTKEFAVKCCPSTALATLIILITDKTEDIFLVSPHFSHLSCWCFHTNKYSQIARNRKEVWLFSLQYINVTGSQKNAVLLFASLEVCLLCGFWKCWNTFERIWTTLNMKQQHYINLKCLTLRTSWMLCI